MDRAEALVEEGVVARGAEVEEGALPRAFTTRIIAVGALEAAADSPRVVEEGATSHKWTLTMLVHPVPRRLRDMLVSVPSWI